ncbi:MAG: hypothetical protein Kow00129_17040 [Thermoleophilia bacterium]
MNKPPPPEDFARRWSGEAAGRDVDLRLLQVDDLVFDERTVLKCRYGCPAWGTRWTCGTDTWGPRELIPLLKKYSAVLLFTGYDLKAVTTAALTAERAALLEGFSFALAVAVTLCSECGDCTYPAGSCRRAADLRPESAMAGIDTLGTLRRLRIEGDKQRGWLRASYVFLA